ncbi:MAG: ornithine cyclodeaminase family protein [bacterium]|jgi:ornithine cyclodeaminase/alanine dehydrogenase-like protein (mu-crystallin family)|nr:ornithine cyclodeaminase family protein [Betaproteobacteria bacterium]
MATLLKEAHVRELLTMADALPAVEQCFRDVSIGEAVNVPRNRGALKGVTVNAMGAISSALDLMAMKVYPIVRQDITVGSSFQVLCWRISTGALVGVLEAELLAQIRTGAASGVATRFMARPDSRVMTLFGAGWQARAQLEAIRLVLPSLERVNVISRSEARVASFIAEMGQVLGAGAPRLLPVTDVEAAVRESDVVTTITGSKLPLFDGAWLPAGVHVNAAGSNFAEKRELDALAVDRAARIVADDVDVARLESGDLIAIPGFDWSRVVPLSDVVGGRAPGRGSPDEITLFESHGLGLEDLAVAAVLLDQAARRGIGIDIPVQ